MKGVIYKGCRLVPGSLSHTLFMEKRYKELDKHEEELAAAAAKRGDVPREEVCHSKPRVIEG